MTIGKERGEFCTEDISSHLKIRMLKCYVFPEMLYGMEAWAFEIWAYGRILKVWWIEKISSAEVLETNRKYSEHHKIRRRGKEKKEEDAFPG